MSNEQEKSNVLPIYTDNGNYVLTSMLRDTEERLNEADSRVLTSQKVSDSLLAKLKNAEELIVAKDKLQAGMMRDNLAISATLGDTEENLTASRELCGRMLEALKELTNATPQEECDVDCDKENCPWIKSFNLIAEAEAVFGKDGQR